MKIVVETTDVMVLFGWSERKSQLHLAEIREALDKPRGAVITFGEFCKYNLINEQEVRQALQPRKAS